MKTSDFYFDLPQRLIAQTPLKDRTASKLLVLDKENGNMEHTVFKQIVEKLKQGDCLVLNNTKVIPARLIGHKQTGAQVGLLLLKRIDETKWETLVKPGRKARVGDKIVFSDRLSAEIVEMLDDGNRIVQFLFDGIFEEILDELGEMPLPPYITEKLADRNRYQTVYAKVDGSAAAPTAGLHFTDDLIAELKEKGVKIAYVTLHVGLGTFRPVKVDDVTAHDMHEEYYEIDEQQATVINETKLAGGRIVAVGTTACRTLESNTDENGRLQAGKGFTGIFIYPGYRFKIVDALITNFHLPESTLIMLVSALAGKENVMVAYEKAIEMDYRFFSFGDAMLIIDGNGEKKDV